ARRWGRRRLCVSRGDPQIIGLEMQVDDVVAGVAEDGTDSFGDGEAGRGSAHVGGADQIDDAARVVAAQVIETRVSGGAVSATGRSSQSGMRALPRSARNRCATMR